MPETVKYLCIEREGEMEGRGIWCFRQLNNYRYICDSSLFNRLVYSFTTMVWQDYIVSDKSILIGKPTIKGTRISVELILELLSSGWSEQQLLESYPQLKVDHIKAVFAYLRDCMKNELFFSLTKTA